MLCRHKLINVPEMVLLKGLHFINLTLKRVQYLYPLSSFWHRDGHFLFFLITRILCLKPEKVMVTVSRESLIRLTHGSSFGNSLGVWDVRAGHYRLRVFSQVAKNLRGITASLVPVPKTSLFIPEIGTVFLPCTKIPCSTKFSFSSPSVTLTSGMLYTFFTSAW